MMLRKSDAAAREKVSRENRMKRNGRGGEIRTHDLLHPKQTRIPGYATPRPVRASQREANYRRGSNRFNIFSAATRQAVALLCD